MTTHNSFRLRLVVICLCSLLHITGLAKEAGSILDRPSSHVNTIFHVGLWVDDVDEMLGFLGEVMEFDVVLRAGRRSGGERVILSDSRGQLIELLSDPENVTAHPAFPLHPRGRVAGIAHMSIWVEDVVALKSRLTEKGYEVLAQEPEDFAEGYLVAEAQMYRILFVRGPGDMTFELFEVKK